MESTSEETRKLEPTDGSLIATGIPGFINSFLVLFTPCVIQFVKSIWSTIIRSKSLTPHDHRLWFLHQRQVPQVGCGAQPPTSCNSNSITCNSPARRLTCIRAWRFSCFPPLLLKLCSAYVGVHKWCIPKINGFPVKRLESLDDWTGTVFDGYTRLSQIYVHQHTLRLNIFYTCLHANVQQISTHWSTSSQSCLEGYLERGAANQREGCS